MLAPCARRTVLLPVVAEQLYLLAPLTGSIDQRLRVRGTQCSWCPRGRAIIPHPVPALQVLEMNPDGVFFSNGPGDPSAAPYAVDNAKEVRRTASGSWGQRGVGCCPGRALTVAAEQGGVCWVEGRSVRRASVELPAAGLVAAASAA